MSGQPNRRNRADVYKFLRRSVNGALDSVTVWDSPLTRPELRDTAGTLIRRRARNFKSGHPTEVLTYKENCGK